MLGSLVSVLLPLACPGCGARAEPICWGCAASIRPAPAAAPPAGIASWAAPFAYEGVVREVVARVKYRGAHAATAWLAASMAHSLDGVLDGTLVGSSDRTLDSALDGALDGVRPGGADGPRADLVLTWVPTTPSRRRTRGFDHAEVLARRLAARLGLPARALLHRDEGPAQTGAPLAQRRVGPRFECRRGPVPARVLVVDDVATTGATLAAAARALRTGGVERVEAVTAARTPTPTPTPRPTPAPTRIQTSGPARTPTRTPTRGR